MFHFLAWVVNTTVFSWVINWAVQWQFMHFSLCYISVSGKLKKNPFLDTQVSFIILEVLKQNQDISKYFDFSINLSYCSVSILICTHGPFSDQSLFNVFPFFFIKKYCMFHWVFCLWPSVASVFILTVFMFMNISTTLWE